MATLKNTTINDTGFLKLAGGTTAQRPGSPSVGMLRYNSTLGFAEQYTPDGWQGIAPPPVITTISPSSFNGETGTTITVNGANFDSTASGQFILSTGTTLTPSSVTRNSASQLEFVTPRDFLASESPASIKVVNGSGLTAQADGVLSFADEPVFTTTSTSLGTINDSGRSTGASTLSTAAATDGGGGSITGYAIVSGSLPSGMSFNTSTAAITGTPNAVSSDTTSNFTVRATDNAGNTTDKAFSITIKGPQTQSFTSTGSATFNVPTGTTSVRVLVVAGGGGGGCRDTGANNSGTDGGSGAGAGGMIDHPSYPVTPGGTVSLSVGRGGYGGSSPSRSPGSQVPGEKGTNSTFGNLTAIGGGYGGCGPLSPNPGGPGGSGGGEGGGGGSSAGDPGRGIGVQPSQPGDSGTYGYGFPGIRNDAPDPHSGSGGGGAGSAANVIGGGGRSSPGGNGRVSNITGSNVTYAGGGGGGAGSASNAHGAGGSGGGGEGGYSTNNANGFNGTNGLGGGGGGGAGNPRGPQGYGGQGGNGIVIVRY